MGRIKTMKIKSVTKEIIAKYEDKLTKDFTGNKEAMKGLVDVPSKKLRNVIAGYVTRLMRNKEEL